MLLNLFPQPTNGQTFTPPASSFLTSAHTHFWRSLLFCQEWCECKELGARNDLHAKAAMYAHLAKDKVLMHDVRGVSTPIRFLMLRDCQNLEYEQQTMGVWMQEKGHTTVEGIN